MVIKYEKNVLDKNVVKFTINDDCMVIGDENNISKLYDYFETLNTELSNGLVLDDQTVSVLSHANTILNGILDNKQQQFSTFDDLLNKHIVLQPHSLSRLTFDEIQAVVKQYGTQDQYNILPSSSHSFKSRANWLKDYFDHVYVNKHLSMKVEYIEGLANVDTRLLKTNFAKYKIRLDRSGGLKTLFRYAQEKRQLSEVTSFFDMNNYVLLRYLLLYGIRGWKTMLKLSSRFSTWDEMASYIVGK